MKLPLLTRVFLFIAFVLICARPSSAQEGLSTKIDRYVKAEMQANRIPGLSLAVVRNGKILLLKNYGLADVENHVSVKPETVFQSGSIGKQFTAAAVMILVEDGKLSLDDSVTRFFSDAPETWKRITVRHLLTHSSGLGDYPPEVDPRRDYTEDQYYQAFKKAPLAFQPGESWDYSNVGYVLLGILIRRVTGKFYGDFLRERIFTPLRMTTARVISEADIIPNRARGYRLERGALKNQEWVSPSTNTTADGSLYLTVLDLAKWDAALYTDIPLQQSSRELIWTPVKLADGRTKPYGFGWHTDTIRNRRVVFHGGAWQGFKSCIIRFLDDKLTIVLFANSWATNDFKLTRGLAAILYPEFALPKDQPIEDREPDVSSIIRRVLLELSRGAVNMEPFSPEFRRDWSSARAKVIADRLNLLSLPVAVIHLSELVERREEKGLRVYRYLLIDIGRTLSCTVKLSGEGKIVSLDLLEE